MAIGYNYPGSIKNSTEAVLANAAVFTGEAEALSITEDTQSVTVVARADEASAVDGLQLQFSADGTNWDISHDFSVLADDTKTISVPLRLRYFRVIYTNGGVTQTEFRLQTRFNKVAVPDLTYPALCTLPLTNGGSSNFAVDGSGTPVAFSSVASGRAAIYRAIFAWEDSGVFRAEQFAAFGAALANGCEFEYTRNGVTIDLLGGEKITNNFDLSRMAYDTELKDWGSGNKFLVARLSFFKFGGPLILKTGDSVTWRVNDDLTGLVSGSVICMGEDL